MTRPTLRAPASALLLALAAALAGGAAPAQADLASYRAAVLADGPVAYWPLDETSGVAAVDLGSGSHDGVLHGAVTSGVGGAFNSPPNRAARFATAGTMTATVPATAKGVELWVRPSARVQQTFVRFGDPSHGGWSLGVNGSSAGGPAKRRIVFTTAGQATNSKLTLATNAWTHVTASWATGNAVRFVLNGGAVTRTVHVGTLPSTDGSGTVMVGPGGGASGTSVDEVALLPGTVDAAAHYTATGLPGQLSEAQLAPLTGVRVGDVLTLTPGTWQAGTTVIDTWQRCDSVGACQALAQTGTTYTATADDAGFTIQVREQATNATGSVIDFTDSTDPVALPNGTQPADPPVLPPGTDPDVPAPVTDPAPLTDPAGPSPTGTTPAASPSPGTTVPLVTPGAPGSSPTGRLPGPPGARSACAAGGAGAPACAGSGRVRITLPPRSRTLVVRAPRRGLRRVEWKVDRRARRHHRAGAVTRIRLPRLAAGRHRIALRLRPRRHAHSRKVTLRLRATC